MNLKLLLDEHSYYQHNCVHYHNHHFPLHNRYKIFAIFNSYNDNEHFHHRHHNQHFITIDNDHHHNCHFVINDDDDLGLLFKSSACISSKEGR